jgi:hypothetical protein
MNACLFAAPQTVTPLAAGLQNISYVVLIHLMRFNTELVYTIFAGFKGLI